MKNIRWVSVALLVVITVALGVGRFNSKPTADVDKLGLIKMVELHEQYMPPVGTVVPYVGKFENEDEQFEWERQSGWVVCDGRSLDHSSLSHWKPTNDSDSGKLNQLLNEKFGRKIPNFMAEYVTDKKTNNPVLKNHGKMPIGVSGQYSDSDIGTTGGRSEVKLTGAELPEHSHRVYRHASDQWDRKQKKHPYWGTIPHTAGAGGEDGTTVVWDLHRSGTGEYSTKPGTDDAHKHVKTLGNQPFSVQNPFVRTLYIMRIQNH